MNWFSVFWRVLAGFWFLVFSVILGFILFFGIRFSLYGF